MKHRKITRNINCGKVWASILLFALPLAALFLLTACAENDIFVMLSDTADVRIVSENPVRVGFGETAEFTLEMDEAIVFDSLPEGVSLDGNVLRVENVRRPMTLKLDTHRRVRCNFSAGSTKNGELLTSLPSGEYWSDTEITLTATPKEGYVFSGYSVGDEIVSVDPSYTFKLSGDLDICANFAEEWVDPALSVKIPEGKWVLIYHSNGGVLASSGLEGSKTVEFSNDFYLCPNTLADRGYFKRDGYVLIGYNTKADGSGRFYGTGWNVVMPEERDSISLFCVWAKVSNPEDFNYVTQNGEVMLTRYKGSDEFVVIPEKINGVPVTKIGSGTFNENSAIKKVMITKNTTIVYDSAFKNCKNLSELYFSDTVKTITDKAFVSCPELKKLYMLAVVEPKYMTARNGTYGIKYERLITVSGRKLIIVSGSNSSYGVNSPLLKTRLTEGGYPYEIVNYGCNAGTAITFYCEVVSKHVNEGDIVVLAPESNAQQHGKNEITTTLWQLFEGTYDAFSDVDIRNFVNLFSSFAEFNRTRNHKSYNEKSYELRSSDIVNEYGDFIQTKIGTVSSYQKTVDQYIANGGYGTRDFYSYSLSYYNSGYVANLNRTLDMIKAKGVRVLFSFAAVNRLSLTLESQKDNAGSQKKHEYLVDMFYNAERISNVSTYAMDTKYFYNADYHPNSAGADLRTENLAKDLLRYFRTH